MIYDSASPTLKGEDPNVPANLNYRLVIENNEVLPANLTIANGGFLEWRKSSPMSLNNLTLENGSVLTHSYNYGAADYQLTVTLTGNLDLKGGSAIDVSERGFKPGTGPGGSLSFPGSHGGMAQYNFVTYGDYKNPTQLGSGGGEASGGGSVQITVAGTTTLNGNILANGRARSRPGSGGSIKLQTGTLTGLTGAVRADGGTSTNSGGAGGGRIAILYTTDNYPISYLSKSAYGGKGNVDGAAGTIFYRDLDNDLYGHLIINNAGRNLNPTITTVLPTDQLDSVDVDLSSPVEIKSGETFRLPSASVGYRLILGGNLQLPSNTNTLIIENNGTLELRSTNPLGSKTAGLGDVRNIIVRPQGKIIHTPNVSTLQYRVDLRLDSLTLDGVINTDSSGFQNSSGPCPLYGNMGACHGGLGDTSGVISSSGFYGDIRAPMDLGSGASGGGSVVIDVNTFNITGKISADATAGGSGGSVYIRTQTLSGSGGSIYARGGDRNAGCGGGGGRISLTYVTDSYLGGIDNLTMSTAGGRSLGGYCGEAGAAGTIFVKSPAHTVGKLILNNGFYSYREGVESVISESLDFDEVVIGSSTTGVFVPSGRVFRPLTNTINYPVRLAGNILMPNSTISSVSDPFNPATDHWGDFVVANGGYLTFDRVHDFVGGSIESPLIVRDFTAEAGSFITHTNNSDPSSGITARERAVYIVAKNKIHLKMDSLIDVNTRGYSPSKGNGAGIIRTTSFNYGGPIGIVNFRGGSGGSGGSHGGLGGGFIRYLITGLPTDGVLAESVPSTDDLTRPRLPGAGGGRSGVINDRDGSGGGLVILKSDNEIILEGSITANGNRGHTSGSTGYGGGAGGAISIETDIISGAFANLQAIGGDAGRLTNLLGGGAGGGGIISILRNTNSYTGSLSGISNVSGGLAFDDVGQPNYFDDGTTRQGGMGVFNEDTP